ncbi:MAG: DUF3304 domain-containing protein [Polaromonas sp.]|nr:DUF3304 domain-containing protein [Polaromonas sp.]
MNPAPGLPFIRIRVPGKMLRMVFLLAFGSLLSACQEPTAGVSIVGYNHTTNRSIYTFTVDGRMGSNLRPESGGGKFSCCVDIPKTWRPGLKVRIRWEYQDGTAIPPPPPPQEAEVDVPRYGSADMDELNVHFYPDHKVKVLVSNKTIRHPDYPPELRWDAPPPTDAAVGRALPETPPAAN